MIFSPAIENVPEKRVVIDPKTLMSRPFFSGLKKARFFPINEFDIPAPDEIIKAKA